MGRFATLTAEDRQKMLQGQRARTLAHTQPASHWIPRFQKFFYTYVYVVYIEARNPTTITRVKHHEAEVCSWSSLASSSRGEADGGPAAAHQEDQGRGRDAGAAHQVPGQRGGCVCRCVCAPTECVGDLACEQLDPGDALAIVCTTTGDQGGAVGVQGQGAQRAPTGAQPALHQRCAGAAAGATYGPWVRRPNDAAMQSLMSGRTLHHLPMMAVSMALWCR
jgi:hypothetical protein